jgi:hypothetical protein
MPVGQLDIYRTANVLLQQYGDEASLISAQRVDALLELGDVEQLLVWQAIHRAVEELGRTQRRPGEQSN